MSDQGPYSISRLKGSLARYLVGKSASALCGFAVFVLAARLLSISDYGIYVTLVAGIDLAVALSSGGLDWVAVRYLPEYRLLGSTHACLRFLTGVAALRLLSLIIVALASWAAMPLLLRLMDLGEYGWAARLCILLLVVEGMARFVRDHVLESLLLQGRSQLSLLARSAAMLGLLGSVAMTSGGVSLQQLLLIELGGAGLGLTMGILLLLHYIHAELKVGTANSRWIAPSASQMFRMAIHNYFSLVLTLSYGSQVLMLIASYLLGAERVAVFGFARNLSEQVRRYLPASFFVGIIRPVVITSFAQTKDFARLNGHASLVYKISVFALCPILLAFVVFGNGILDLLSDHRYGHAKAYTIALIALLIPFSHRQVLEMVVNTLNRPVLWSRAALWSLLILPLAIAFLMLDWGIWGLIAAIGAGEVTSNIVLVYGLRKAGYLYRVDYSGLARIALAAGLSYAVLAPFQEPPPGVTTLVVSVGSAGIAFLIAAYLVHPFNKTEIDVLSRIIPKWMVLGRRVPR